MGAAESIKGLDMGRLAANGMMVRLLQSALSHADSNARSIPTLIKNLTSQDAWREYIFPDTPGMEPVRWTEKQFRDFIETKRPKGCGTPIGLLARMLRDTDAWEILLKLTRGEQGAFEGNQNGAGLRTGNLDLSGCSTNRHNMTVGITPTPPSPDVIPFVPEVSQPPSRPPRQRNNARESRQGDSVSYAVRRLGKYRPDLLERVRAGELSAHAAMVEAGFIPKAITIPDEPVAAARRLLRHFQGDRLAQLIHELQTRSRAESN
jgi:hypothetical protein